MLESKLLEPSYVLIFMKTRKMFISDYRSSCKDTRNFIEGRVLFPKVLVFIFFAARLVCKTKVALVLDDFAKSFNFFTQYFGLKVDTSGICSPFSMACTYILCL